MKKTIFISLAIVMAVVLIFGSAYASSINAEYYSHYGTITTGGPASSIADAVSMPDDDKFIQLAPDSWITLRFPLHTAAFPDGTIAPDLRIDTYDVPYLADAEVFLSLDGVNWTSAGVWPDTANIDLDLNGGGPVKFVKVDQADHYIDPAYPTLGFDLDAIVALNTGTLPYGEITKPDPGATVSGSVAFEAIYWDDNPGIVQWAIRYGACTAATGTVFGNVDGFNNAYSWDGHLFQTTADTSSWIDGTYCFVFNPREETGEQDIRLTQFNVVSNNEPPVADPNGPYLGAINVAMGFDGSASSDPNGDPLTYTWDFGDGTTGTGIGPNHIYTSANLYNVCLTVDDGQAVSDSACTIAIVYDPDGGFVTGGGWINSPSGAFVKEGPIQISGDTALISYGGYTGYMYRNLNAVCDPNNTPVTFTGTLDVSGLQDNGADLFGLLDKQYIDQVSHGFQTGAYVYVGRRGNNLIVGPSDGNAGGEIVQTFTTFVDYFANGTPSPLPIAAEIFNGVITVTVSGNNYTDDYGTVPSSLGWMEFEYGAYIGIDSWPSSNSTLYDLSFEGCEFAPTGKASFGFVSKYKKGTSVPEGNTEFQFKAGDLNFHSSSYDWLVINQNDSNAQFKGTGTINGTGEYKFMLWAGDHDPDTFRIKIWYEDNGNEIVVYDNGTDQIIGGGNIVVHTSK